MLIRQQNVEEEPPVTLMPLIDMVFLLLIFFLVATTLAQEERDTSIQLPGTSIVQPLSAPPQQLIINIRANGDMAIGARTIKGNEQQALREVLARVAKDEPNREVLIRCDEMAYHKYFAGVASICREAGIHEVKVGYVLNSPAPTQIR